MTANPLTALEEHGLAAFAAKDFEICCIYLAAAVEAGSRSADVHYSLGFSYRVLGDGTKAEKQFSEACQLNDTSAHFRYNLGKQIGLNGDLLGALPHFATAMELQPVHPGPYFDAGSCLARSSFSELATICYLMAGVYCALNDNICPDLGITLKSLKISLDVMEATLGERFQIVLEDTYKMFGDHDPRVSNFLPNEVVITAAHAVASALRAVAAPSDG